MPKTLEKYSKGMVYGVFDGFHEGHHYFLTQAAAQCKTLVVVVAHPDIVSALKEHLPYQDLEERIDALRRFDARLLIEPGDKSIGTWSALKKHKPDIVFLGYDQDRLGLELEKLGVPSMTIPSHRPDIFKSSLLLKKKSS